METDTQGSESTNTAVAEKPNSVKALETANKAVAEQAAAEARNVLKASRAKGGDDVIGTPAAAKVGDAPTGEQPRGEDGKFTPKETAAETKPANSGKHDKDEFQKAVTALLKTKVFTPEEVAAMPPDLVMSKYKGAAEHQATLDREFQAGNNARKELEAARLRIAEFEKSAKPSGADSKNQTADGSPPFDLKAAAQPISAKLKSLLGDDVDVNAELEAFASTILNTAQTGLAESRNEAKAASEKITALEGRMNTILDEQVRPELEKRFSKLKDASSWETLRGKASELVKAGIVEDRQSALRSAAAMEYGLEAAEEAQKRQREIDKAKTNGQPYSGGQVTPASTPIKPEDRQKTFLRLVRAGNTPEQANSMIGSG